jgi:hypothetical protein
VVLPPTQDSNSSPVSQAINSVILVVNALTTPYDGSLAMNSNAIAASASKPSDPKTADKLADKSADIKTSTAKELTGVKDNADIKRMYCN